MQPLVSIVIPCYNAEPWIGEAIRSALNQTYSPVEVIVIDDGSTDRSLEVIKSFGDKIRWETGTNRGGDRARNGGFALSAGEYIQFLDADDYLLPGKIERQMRIFSNGRADVVYEDSQNLLESADGSQKWGSLDISGAHTDILEMLLSGWAPPPCAFMISRSAVEKAGGWNERLTSAQDNDFYIRLALVGATYVYVPGCQCVYRDSSAPRVSTRSIRATDENLVCVLREAGDKLLRSGRLTLNYRRAIAQSLSRVAHKYFDADFDWHSRLLREALQLSPSAVGERTRTDRILARALGRVRSFKRKGIRRLKDPMRTLPAERTSLMRASNDGLRGALARVPILLYHNVGPLPLDDPFNLTVAIDQFEHQMRRLVSLGYQTIWPSDWLSARREGRRLPERTVMVTFDDGYAEMVEHAFPVLRRYGLKAAVYVVTKRLGLTNTWDEVNGHRTMRLMSADQVREWARQGLEFGSHMRTHPHLTSLSEQRLTDEIEGSRDDLQSLLGGEVLSFAYPYGDGAENSRIREKLIRTYLLGMTVQEGLNYIETNPYELRRIMIRPGDSIMDFEHKLRGRKTLATWARAHLPRRLKTVARLGLVVLHARHLSSAAIGAQGEGLCRERIDDEADRAVTLTDPGPRLLNI
jgi:glycosyltransferase involved in cell wall biosynthesis/peptidoglycan/xylan/chitin deacetylase (PgdA/CDA1 family)